MNTSAKPTRVPTFMDEVIAATPGDTRLRLCLHCGTCGGSCPSGQYMDHTPRTLFAMIRAGLKHRVLTSNTPWHCLSCYYCRVRCPQDIHIPSIMHTLKRMAIQEKLCAQSTVADAPDFSQACIHFVGNYGRNLEFGVAARYHLSHHPLEIVKMIPIGLRMSAKGRMGITPKRIGGIRNLKAILARARQLEGVA
ncbi:MAG: hypothetical protein GTO14_06460 [Anaerolineales bacterium]|nr:hypothetical protein [Anaerolineales bacterium]